MRNKLSYESIAQSFGSSFTIRTFDKAAMNVNPSWHFHPELELVYINGGSGRRHVGQHLSFYKDGDLLLLGSNLPHYGFTNRQSKNDSETIIQFTKDFLGDDFLQSPELKPVGELLERAEYGIKFTADVRKRIGPDIESIPEKSPFERLLAFIKLLKSLAETEDYILLNKKKIKGDGSTKKDEKIDEIFGIIRRDFQQDISLPEMAEQAKMTVPAFCRYFKKQSGKTFTQFVNEYRIIKACTQLKESSKMITTIAEESGYKNFSYFTRQFQKFTGKTPTVFRQELRELIN